MKLIFITKPNIQLLGLESFNLRKILGRTLNLLYDFRAIQEQMSAHGQEPVSFEDVKDEIFDMVKPADPTRITLKVKRAVGCSSVTLVLKCS